MANQHNGVSRAWGQEEINKWGGIVPGMVLARYNAWQRRYGVVYVKPTGRNGDRIIGVVCLGQQYANGMTTTPARPQAVREIYQRYYNAREPLTFVQGYAVVDWVPPETFTPDAFMDEVVQRQPAA